MNNISPDNALTIGKLARATGASVRSIRHYDQQGLLTSFRTCNGYRSFPSVAIVQVRQIQRMIATGFSLAEIGAFPDCMLLLEGAKTCSEITETQRRRLAVVDAQIGELEKIRERLRITLQEGAVPPLDEGDIPRRPFNRG